MSPSDTRRDLTLDPVTFEVLKNAFVTSVDLMAEQILRTCHSFVIYSRDFSSALCDAEGNTVMQGSQDIAVHATCPILLIPTIAATPWTPHRAEATSRPEPEPR